MHNIACYNARGTALCNVQHAAYTGKKKKNIGKTGNKIMTNDDDGGLSERLSKKGRFRRKKFFFFRGIRLEIFFKSSLSG